MPQLLVLPVTTIPVHYRPNHLHRSITGITDIKLTNSQSSKTICSFRTNRRNQNEELPRDFEPGPFDVICSQGKTARTHAGNIHFQSVIHNWAEQYVNAIEKRNKSKIVRNIIETIRTKSLIGGFVKKDSDGQWWVVAMEQAREKVSQSLRDTLAGHYRSSLMAKKRSRMESNLKRMIDFEEISGTNRFVSQRMRWLSETMTNNNDSSGTSNLSDSDILNLMTDTNFCILRQLKKDRTVHQKIGAEQSQQRVEEQNEWKASSPSSDYAVDEMLTRFQTDKEFMLLQQPTSKRCKK